MKFTILVDPSLVIINIYLVCLTYAWECNEHFYRKNAFPLYYLYGHAQAQEPLPRGSGKLPILVDPSLVIITLYLVCPNT